MVCDRSARSCGQIAPALKRPPQARGEPARRDCAHGQPDSVYPRLETAFELLKRGDYQAACPKLAESYWLDPRALAAVMRRPMLVL